MRDSSVGGEDLGQVHGPHPGPQPGQAAADVQQAGGVAGRADLGPGVQHRRILSASIAVEMSAFFTANVPPKPQHSSAPGSSTRSIPRTARSSRSGLSPTRSIRSEWQVGW